MPVLTKDQVFEAVMELEHSEREEVLERLAREQSPAPLSPEQECELREAFSNQPVKAIPIP